MAKYRNKPRIIEAVQWLGFEWGEHLYFASDYFDKMYAMAEHLITVGKAYVDSLSAEEMRAYRGTLSAPGQDSPYRNRSVEENLAWGSAAEPLYNRGVPA